MRLIVIALFLPVMATPSQLHHGVKMRRPDDNASSVSFTVRILFIDA
jgi:hypothetical protein